MGADADRIRAVAMSEIVLLGSGGWIPTSARATCSALVRAGDHAVVLDAGTGIGRLVENPDLLAGVRRLDLVLTHFHLDHVVGLAYLPALSPLDEFVLMAPGEWLYGAPTAAILDRLVGPPFSEALAATVPAIEEISQEGARLGEVELRVRRQSRHTLPTLALRLGDELTYCTDTAYDEGNVEFAGGSRILAHEAWYTEDAPREESTHSSAAQAASVARDAGVEQLALIHVRPGIDERDLGAEAAVVFDRAVVGSDLLRLG
jgi:ribonuclease BN (tRNA processing enzyme)